MTVKLLTEHHLEFLSLKGGCRGLYESTHVKMPHCWKSVHWLIYKCSKILNTFLFLFSNKLLVFMAGIHIMLVRIGTREEPDQTASLEAV